MMKLLSFQPVSLYQNGGAARVLRRLYAGNEGKVTSLGVIESPLTPQGGAIAETIIAAKPLQKRWMRWKIRNIARWLREQGFKSFTQAQLQKTALAIPADVIHMVHHGPYADALCTPALLKDKQLWVSFHDYFSTAGPTEGAARARWQQADRRLVISKEMGEEYNRLFGAKPYEIITDGLLPGEISPPRIIDPGKTISVYFSGLLHIEYYPLFEVLADVLDELSAQGLSFKLILRGTQQLSFLHNRKFQTDYRTNFISDDAIKKELDDADILYLPIKFTTPAFYLYSMSTKMVGYLGAPGSILYHGPVDSAACRLLNEAQAAVCCGSLDWAELLENFRRLLNNHDVSANAKKLAAAQFDMNRIRTTFWNGFNKEKASAS